jgi:aspartate/methionine/tyrosine aminotransferase
MKIPKVELFEWLLKNYERADYVLGFSNIQGLTKGEYDQIVGYEAPPDFDLGWDAHYGAQDLKEALCAMYGCHHENIVTASGGSEANFLSYLSLLDKGDDFIMERPGYQPMWLAPEMLGANRIDWTRRPEDGFKLDLEALRDLFTPNTKMIVMTNLHNPSGVLAGNDVITRVAELAKDHEAHLLIDEVFLDGSFKSQESAYGIPNVIITSSMTKVYGLGGFRTGWIIAEEKIAVECQLAKAHTDAASAYLGEIMNAQALIHAREHLVQRFLNKAQGSIGIVRDWIESNPDLVEWVEPDGGIMCFPRYKADIGSKELCQKLLDDHGVLVNPGEYFNMEKHFRLSYTCPDDMLKAGLEEITKCLREHSQ